MPELNAIGIVVSDISRSIGFYRALGKAYGARTTPHMYVIDPAGTLVYAGAIDSKPTANPADIATATNHVGAALSEALAGKAVSQATTRPYGCAIKYTSAAG